MIKRSNELQPSPSAKLQSGAQPRRPHPQHAVQRQTTASSPAKREPVAPPVYRPQPVPKVLQTKRVVIQRDSALRTNKKPLIPQPNEKVKLPSTIVQAKHGGLGARQASSVSHHPPALGKSHVIQRMALTVGGVDETIRESMGIILVRKEGQQPPGLNAQLPSLENGNLANIGQDETLYLDGHGAAAVNNNIPSFAQKFGGYTPEELAAKLVAKGLPNNYAGKIYLNGCNTANDNGGEAFSLRFQKALALRNRFVRVKGNKGFSQVQDSGKTRVNPPTQQGGVEHAALDQLKNRMKDYKTETQQLILEARNPQTSNQRITEIKLRIGELKIDIDQLRHQTQQQRQATFLPDKHLRPVHGVLQNLHYEITKGNYAAIPGDDHNGKSLKTFIKRALDRYDNQWNLLASTESTQASPILRNLLNNSQKLFVAVRWYLTANQPKPPTEFVQVSPKLNAGSDLYRYLQEEFQAWSA